MAIVVTGGAGYIGSHTCKALALAGERPVVVDNLSAGHRSAVRWGPLEVGDLADGDFVEAVLRRHRVDAVIHFAAHAYVGESMTAPGKYFRNNVANAVTLFEAMRRTGVRLLVFSSSCAVYGLPDVVPIREEQAPQPMNPYGESKLMVERMVDWYGRIHGMRSVVLRYFNAAGADPDGELGERHEPETHLIPLVLHTALGRRVAVDVFGDDYPTPDGTAVRDYIHVADLAAAHVGALMRLRAGGSGGIFNLGAGIGHSVRQVIETAQRICERRIAVHPAPRRAGDPPVLVADATKARRELGFEPRLSSLENMIGSAWMWYQR